MAHDGCRVLLPPAPETLPTSLSFPVDAPADLLRTTRVDSGVLAVLIEHVDLTAAATATSNNLLMEALTHQVTGCGVGTLPGQVAVLRHRLAVQLALRRHRYLDDIVEAVTRNYCHYDGSAFLDLNRIPNMQSMVDGYIRDTGDAWTGRAFGREVIRACADSEEVNVLLLMPGRGTALVSPHHSITPLRTVCLVCFESEGEVTRYSSVLKVDFSPRARSPPVLPPAPPASLRPASPDSGLESSPPPRTGDRPVQRVEPVMIKTEDDVDSVISECSASAKSSRSDYCDSVSVKLEGVKPEVKSDSKENASKARRPVHKGHYLKIPVQDEPLTLATWNVGYLSAASDRRKLPRSPWMGVLDGPAGAARALACNGVQIAALQGRDPASHLGELEGYTVFAHDAAAVAGAGTGFAVRDELVGAVSSFVSSPSARACRLDVFGAPIDVSLVCALAPPEEADEREHELFYRALDDLAKDAPPDAVLLVMGDFAAEVGQRPEALRCVAGVSSLHRDFSDNGVRLLRFATRNDLVIRSTMLDKKLDARATRVSPTTRSDGSERLSCSQVDHVLVRRCYRGSVCSVRAVPEAGLSDSNHRMVLTVVSAPFGDVRREGQRPKPSVSEVLEKMTLWTEARHAVDDMYLRMRRRAGSRKASRRRPKKEEEKEEKRIKQEAADEGLDDVMADLGRLLEEVKECESLAVRESRPSRHAARDPRRRRQRSPGDGAPSTRCTFSVTLPGASRPLLRHPDGQPRPDSASKATEDELRRCRKRIFRDTEAPRGFWCHGRRAGPY